MKRRLASLVILLSVGCAHGAALKVPAADLPLRQADGTEHALRGELAKGPLTVVLFFGRSCPVQFAHDARLIALYERVHPRGVQFVAVDSEVEANAAEDAKEQKQRGYPFAIVTDERARLADALGAEYATTVVVLDSQGAIHYRGSIDTDRTHLRDDATPLLGNALDDLLAGREPRQAEGAALGCALRKW